MLLRGLVALLFALIILSAIGTIRTITGSRATSDLIVNKVAAWLEPSSPAGEPAKIFVVPPGEDAGEIAERLAREDVVDNPTLLRFLLSYYNVDRELKAGRYSLRSEAGLIDIVRALQEGRPEETVTVTIPEGLRAEEIAAILQRKGVAQPEEFLRLARSGGGVDGGFAFKPPIKSLEGYLFPETYIVPESFEAADFLELVLATFEERFPADLLPEETGQGRNGQSGELSVHEIVTLASIVERETPLPEERPLVAGVFMNRLREGIPLEADPTVQYALVPQSGPLPEEGYWKRELTLDDLGKESPYNTYVVKGLPLGPIANPGLESLRAVLQPKESRYLYFVAKPDGSHAFSSTLAEHQRNVARYQQEQ